MSKIIVDLNTRILNEEHQVFVARPGKDYRLYPEFSDYSAVMLELPSLDLERGKRIDTYTDLAARIIRSRRIRNWHRRGRPEDDIPPRDLSEYAGRSLDRGEAQLQGLVRALFERAQRGDLVVVPPKSFTSDALVGELLDDPCDIVDIAVDRMFPSDPLPARRVKWLANIPKRDLSLPIIEAIQKPTTFFVLQRSLKFNIYEEAYPSFVIGDDAFSCRFEVTSADFKSRDDFLIQSFFNFVAANTKALDENRLDAIQGLREAAFIDSGTYDSDLRTNINSPGWLALISRHSTPIIAATLLSIALEVDPIVAVQAAENDTIVLGNSASSAHSDACTVPVHHHVVNHIKLLGLDKWPEACETAREAAKRSGLKSPVKADIQP